MWRSRSPRPVRRAPPGRSARRATPGDAGSGALSIHSPPTPSPLTVYQVRKASATFPSTPDLAPICCMRPSSSVLPTARGSAPVGPRQGVCEHDVSGSRVMIHTIRGEQRVNESSMSPTLRCWAAFSWVAMFASRVMSRSVHFDHVCD
jgi:hypothetical protein